MLSLPAFNPESAANEITGFISDRFAHAQKKLALIALSGGIDSATSLFLTAKALGPNQVYTLHLPSKTTNPQHSKDAKLVANAAQIPSDHQLQINIGAILQKSWRIINHYTPPLKAASVNRLRLGNLSARIRMLVLFDQAKKLDTLVVGTENYSEHLLGYFTRFGDEASDLEPIRHLYKTQVISLAQHLGVPDPIIAKKPSADLWPHQSDALELGFTYQEADPILFALDQKLPKSEIIAQGVSETLYEKVIEQINHTNFKHQVPYSFTPNKPEN